MKLRSIKTVIIISLRKTFYSKLFGKLYSKGSIVKKNNFMAIKQRLQPYTILFSFEISVIAYSFIHIIC